MLSGSKFDLRRFPPWILLLTSIVAVLLFALPYLIEVRIILENPNYGEVTGFVETSWRILLGSTTIGSFVIGVYNLFSDSNSPEGPATGFSIEGKNHDIDFHIHVDDLSENSLEDNEQKEESSRHSDEDAVSQMEEREIQEEN